MPSPHCRQPCVLRSKPAAVVSFIAPSSTESPMTSGGRPSLRLSVVRRTSVPPQPACAAGTKDQSRPTTAARTGQRRFMPPETLPFRPAATHGLPVDPVRRLLPARAGAELSADVQAAPAQAVHPVLQLRLLRGGEPQ